VKYDGYRAQIAVAKGKATVFTRSGLDWTDKFQAIADAVAKLPVKTALIDGEIVAFKDGKPANSTQQSQVGSIFFSCDYCTARLGKEKGQATGGRLAFRFTTDSSRCYRIFGGRHSRSPIP